MPDSHWDRAAYSIIDAIIVAVLVTWLNDGSWMMCLFFLSGWSTSEVLRAYVRARRQRSRA